MITKIYDDSVGGGVGTQNVTRSLVVPSGRNRILLVLVTSETDSGQGGAYNTNGIVTGITFDGVALTKIDAAQGDNGSSTGRAELWYLKNPNVTTANLVVTRTGQVAGSEVSSAVFSGVNLKAPINVSNVASAASGTTWPVAVTTTKPNCVLVGGVGATTGVGTASDGGQTSLVFNSNNGFTKGFAYKDATTPGSHSLSWTGNDSRWGAVATSLRPFRPSGFAALL